MCDSNIQQFLGYINYIAIPPITILIFLAVLILVSNIKSAVNRIYFIIIFFMTAWVSADFLSFQLQNPNHIVLADQISSLGLIGAAFIVLFIHIFPEEKKVSKVIVGFIFVPLIPFFALVPTTLYEKITSFSNCEITTGPLFWAMLALLLYYLFFGLITAYKKFKILKGVQRDQFKIFTVGILSMLGLAIALDIIPTIYSNDSVTLFVPYATLIFAVSCGYAIVRYKAMNVKVVAAQMLTVMIWILIFSEFFFVHNTVNYALVGVTFLLSIVFGIYLIKSVSNEVKRKEELQKMSDQLALANEKLRQLDKAKSEFISIASHQLRTPLTAIKGFVSLLLEGTYGQIPEAQKGALEKVYISNERLVQLVEDLLNISRIDAGRMEFDFQETQIEDMVQEVVNTLELSAKAKRLYLEWKKPEISMPKIKIDITKIKEVISNMVDNAIKYTPKGGVTVRLESENAESGTDKVLRVVVSDTGMGMDKDELEGIFEKFQRGKQSSHYHTDGTGLGMYVGKKIVAAHKGRIWAESSGKNQGSKFILELPIN